MKKKIELEPFFVSENGEACLYHGEMQRIISLLFIEYKADAIFADPPYFLSNGGITCKSGKMESVNKGKWDESKGLEENHTFNLEWLGKCKEALAPNGTIWITGTSHVIYSIGYGLQQLNYRILNDIVWEKMNPPPNLSCRYFTHSTEIIIWAAKEIKSKHFFDYALMKETNKGKQMKNVWRINAPRKEEKLFGKHPTQKPIELLRRIILASTRTGDLVLDPFCGSGTTGVAALELNRRFVGIDTEKGYLELSKKRILDALRNRTLL
jgi:site-specific DNA-methyltransferase (adenine-specific)